MKSPAKMLLLAASAALALFIARPAAAYDGPWCAVFNIGFGDVLEKCDMPSFETCRQEAQYHGASAFCRQNSRFAPYWGVGVEPRHVRAKKRHRHAG